MDQGKIIKGMKLAAIVFVVVSIIEIIFVLIMGFTPVNINNETVTLTAVIFNPVIVPAEGMLFWIFMIVLMCFYLVLGLVFFKLSIRKEINSKVLAKYLTVLGMLVLIMTFVRIEYYILLAKTPISYTTAFTPPTFQSLLYSHNITPFIVVILWIFFMSVSCFYLIIGLIISAGALKWQLEIDKSEKLEGS
jgi:hypothetical protein